MAIHLRDVHYLDPQTGELRHGDLVVEPGPDGEVRPADASAADASAPAASASAAPPAPDDVVIAAHGALALPGLVCAHHHIYSALARGMPAPPRAPRSFAEILELVWWRVDRALDRDMIRASALAAGLDAIRCGATAVIDHHSSPHASDGCLEVIASALDELGLAHVLCLELSDRDGPDAAEAGLVETARYLGSGRPALVGLHASFTVGDALLARAVDLARTYHTGLHLHVAEGAVDQERCLADHGCRVIARLADAGVLDQPGTLLVHGLHLDGLERERVRRSPAWVVQNPESNQNNAVGRFRWAGLDPDRVLLGTDGLHGDMLRSLRAAHFNGQAEGLAPGTAWNLLASNRRYLAAHHPGAARRNDLVLLDYPAPTPLTAENLPGHALFGLDARHVRTVIAGGRVVLQDGEFTTIDQDATLASCREQAHRLWAALARSSPKGQP